jgi:hypothetical protein
MARAGNWDWLYRAFGLDPEEYNRHRPPPLPPAHIFKKPNPPGPTPPLQSHGADMGKTAVAKGHSQISILGMPLRDAIFWIALTVFGYGLSLLKDSPLWAGLAMALGIAGLIFSLRHHVPSTSRRASVVGIAMLVAIATSGYDIYDRHFGTAPAPPAIEGTQAAPQPTATAPKVDKTSHPARTPGDADREIQVIDSFFEILRKEARPQPQKGRDILSEWQDALDDAKQPAYFQAVDRYRNEVLATNSKIWDMIQQFPQYCDNDICAMIDPRQNVNLTDAFDQLKKTLTDLRGIIDPSVKRGNPALVRLVAPAFDRIGTQIFEYNNWIIEAENKLSDRRKELGKGGR